MGKDDNSTHIVISVVTLIFVIITVIGMIIIENKIDKMSQNCIVQNGKTYCERN